jgi:LuxR family maltose regulon positive regulatory protein
MSTPLLHAKLMPPRLHATVIPRTGLLARLDDGLGKRLTLVIAPTGFGKTTLVSQWLAERRLPIAWVALDENDNDPVRFWTYVISALRTLDAEIGKTALATLSTAQILSFQSILTPLINELARLSTQSVLVLEDYHAIALPEIHAALAFLLQHKPETLSVVIISRAEPDLPLGILRARDELTEITAADLRFDRAETEVFLRETLKGELPPTAVEKLLERTEGWAAGLRLAALSLQNKGGATAEQIIESFSGGQRFVADYLIREVFANQPENIQSFLLKTCFLNRLTGALCAAITERSDGESILEQLERENLFVVQLAQGRGRAWYRYAPLFAESLQGVARQHLGTEGVRSIFQKASDWYAGQHLFDDAIEMALAAGLFERVLELVETFIEIYDLKEMGTLTRWLERIPVVLTMAHPAVCMAYAQVILFSSDRYAPATAARIEPYLRAAEQVWVAAGNEAKVGTVLALRGMMLLWQGEFQKSLAAVYAALEKMPESEVFWRGVSLLNVAGGEMYAGRMLSAQDKILEARALLGASQNIFGLLAASGMLSEIFYAQGDLELCVQLCEQVMAEAVGDDSMLDDQGNARLNLAHAAYEQNDLETAARYAAEAFDLGQQRANELLQAQAAGRSALIRTAKGELAQARADLKALAAQMKTALAQTEIRTVEARLSVRAGEAPGAWLTTSHEALAAQKERETFILARWQIVAGQPAAALALLQPILDESIAHGRVRSQVEALCLLALAAKDLPQAAEWLTQALAIGHEKGFRRLFLDENARMAALLKEILPALTKRPVSLYATTLLHLFSPELISTPSADSVALALVEPLSQQEFRVLKLLVAGLSNGEIARELVVSTNTVKTHVKSIYRKLNINSREEARVVVKELKLL